MRYEWNNSTRWDERELVIDRVGVESRYTMSESDLVTGEEIMLHFESKGGRIKEWNNVTIVASYFDSRSQ